MNRPNSSLEDDVSKVLARAYSEQDYAVAEHLLRALEDIAQREGGGGGTNKRVRPRALRLVKPLHDR